MSRSIKLVAVALSSAALLACLVAAANALPRTAPAIEAEVICCCTMNSEQNASDGTKSQQQSPQTKPDAASDAPPAKRAPSTTQPQTMSVRGVVNVSSRLDLQKTDLTRVVVYLASDPSLDEATPLNDHVSVAQKNKSFIPNFTVVQRGTTVEFPNWDDFDHNVFSRSKAAPAFDLDRYPRGQSKSRVFEKIGVVQVFCNIHPQMRAVIFVTPNRYFARADAEGRFEIKDVPPGQYEVVAWQERCGEQRQPIAVGGPEAPPELTLTLQENRQSIIANDPPQRDSGYGIERGLGVKREKLNLPTVKDSHPAPDAPPK